MLDFREQPSCRFPVYFGQSRQSGLCSLRSAGQSPENDTPVFEDHTDA